MTRTGIYHVAKLVPAPDDSGAWDTRFYDAELMDRDRAIDWVNYDRPHSLVGTLYRLVELEKDELDRILEEDDQ